MVRNRRLESLRKGRVRVLVATDVAARGIDVPTISHVFNYGLPMKAEDYVHRIGRTGRAGREGISVTFAQRNDAFKIRQIERYINSRINVTQIKGLEPQLTHEDFKAGKPSKGRGGARSNGSRSAAPRHGARSDAPRHGARSGAPRSAESGEFRGGYAHGKSHSDASRGDRSAAHSAVRHGRADARSEATGFGHERAARPAFGEDHRPRREHRGKQTESRAFAKPFADTRSARPSGRPAGHSAGRSTTGAKPRANRKPSF
jgi:superfamily II DNA/RNA helicase